MFRLLRCYRNPKKSPQADSNHHRQSEGPPAEALPIKLHGVKSPHEESRGPVHLFIDIDKNHIISIP